MIAAPVHTVTHERRLAWHWPMDLSVYDQRPRLTRREAASASQVT